MIEDHRDGRPAKCVLDEGDHRRVGVDLDMPAAILRTIERGVEAPLRLVRIVDASGREIDAHTADARFVHRIELGIGIPGPDHGDAARILAAGLHAEKCRGIVSAVDARRDDHHTLHLKRPVQRLHFLGRGGLGRVDTPFEPGESCGITVDVRMAIARAGRDGEIDRCAGLRRLGQYRSRMAKDTCGDRAKHNITSRCHSDSPGWTTDLDNGRPDSGQAPPRPH